MRDKAHIAALDGMRGFAALVVLASHVHTIGDGLGTMAVWFFFVLSAFLLTTPFATQADAYAPLNIIAFLIRRLFRILPLYAAFVVIYGFISPLGRTYIFDNLVLFRGTGHLWTINQELVFYLVLPFIALAILPLRKRPMLVAALLLAVAAVIGRFLTIDVLAINAIASSAPFYVSPFLVGMALCFAYPTVSKKLEHLSEFQANCGVALFAVAIAALAAWLLASSTPTNNVATLRPFPIALLLGSAMVWVIGTPANAFKSFAALPACRHVGELGFGIYLFHWIAVELIPHGTNLGWLITIAAMSYGMARVGYLVVEKPAIALGRLLADRVKKPARRSELVAAPALRPL